MHILLPLSNEKCQRKQQFSLPTLSVTFIVWIHKDISEQEERIYYEFL